MASGVKPNYFLFVLHVGLLKLFPEGLIAKPDTTVVNYNDMKNRIIIHVFSHFKNKRQEVEENKNIIDQTRIDKN